MEITLDQSLKNRQKVLDNVKEEIIGPDQMRDHYVKFNPIGTTEFSSRNELYTPYFHEVGGVKEEILQRETPIQRYVSGLLYPLGINEEGENSLEIPMDKTSLEEDTDKLEKLFELQEGIENTEDDGEIELFPQSNDYVPSAMGLTFCVAKHTPSLKVRITGGSYTPHNVRVKGESKTVKWWLRETVKGVWNIELRELFSKKQMETNVELRNEKKQKISKYNIQFQARLRVVNDKFIITVSVTNRTEIKGRSKSELILFQSTMNVETPQNYSFSTYPKQYQMHKNFNEEEEITELLYRNESVYAFGHGCAAHWEEHNASQVNEICTTFLPEYETLSMTPNVMVKQGFDEVELQIKMSDLAGLSSKEHPKKILNPLINSYSEWIIRKRNEITSNVPDPLQQVARKNIELCEESLKRMKKGLVFLEDDQVLKAFRFANLAILLQQVNGKEKRTGNFENKQVLFNKSFEENTNNEINLKNADNSWRAFQIAFLLLSIESFANEKSESREIVDLIWFPTGGGKTEAYLGVAAFQMTLRRLRDPMDAGVDVIMRYTLRLLTADQFQRSSRLICSLEYIRKGNSKILGEIPFSIGIWVGSKTTPNNNKNASINLSKLQKGTKDAQEFIVNSCSWCGASLGYYKENNSKKQHYLGYKMQNNKLMLYCPDKNCPFHEELPIYIVDETIYEKRPTFLIGTIDKFVQLVWKPEARSLFGIDWSGNKFVNPPSLIVQDELHLISGPLGTLAGLFEELIEELCLKNIDDRIVRSEERS